MDVTHIDTFFFVNQMEALITSLVITNIFEVFGKVTIFLPRSLIETY